MKRLFSAVLVGVVAGVVVGVGVLFEISLPTGVGVAVLPVWVLIGGLVGFLAEWKRVPAKDKYRWGALAWIVWLGALFVVAVTVILWVVSIGEISVATDSRVLPVVLLVLLAGVVLGISFISMRQHYTIQKMRAQRQAAWEEAWTAGARAIAHQCVHLILEKVIAGARLVPLDAEGHEIIWVKRDGDSAQLVFMTRDGTKIGLDVQASSLTLATEGSGEPHLILWHLEDGSHDHHQLLLAAQDLLAGKLQALSGLWFGYRLLLGDARVRDDGWVVTTVPA